MLIGVLALHGAFAEHNRILANCGIDSILIRKRSEVEHVNGLIISGVESTKISNLIRENNLCESIFQKVQQGMPVFGTGAGLTLIAQDMEDRDPFSIGLLDVRVRRNGFVHQEKSFEVGLEIDALGKGLYPGIFIRSPYVESVKPNVGILAQYDGKIVMIRQGNYLGAAFHPELTDDLRIHLYFKQMIQDAKET